MGNKAIERASKILGDDYEFYLSTTPYTIIDAYKQLKDRGFSDAEASDIISSIYKAAEAEYGG